MTPTAVHFTDSMASIGWLIALLVNLGTLILMWSGKKEVQKREVSFGSQFVTQEFCDMKHAESFDRTRRSEAEVVEIRKELVAEVSKLHTRIDEILRAVSRLEGKIDR